MLHFFSVENISVWGCGSTYLKINEFYKISNYASGLSLNLRLFFWKDTKDLLLFEPRNIIWNFNYYFLLKIVTNKIIPFYFLSPSNIFSVTKFPNSNPFSGRYRKSTSTPPPILPEYMVLTVTLFSSFKKLNWITKENHEKADTIADWSEFEWTNFAKLDLSGDLSTFRKTSWGKKLTLRKSKSIRKFFLS